MYMSIFVKTQWTCWSSLWGMFVNPLKCKQEAYYFLYGSTYLCNLAYMLLIFFLKPIFPSLSFVSIEAIEWWRRVVRSMPIAYRSVYIVYLRSMRIHIWVCIMPIAYAVCVYTYGCVSCQQHIGVCIWCIYAVCVYTYGLYGGVISGVSCSTTQYAYTQMGYMEE